MTCRTALAEAELEYNDDHISKSVFFSVRLASWRQNAESDVRLLVWTTTPWTIPSNTAICLNKKIEYCVAELNSRKYIMAKSRAINLGYKILHSISADEMLNTEYFHPFSDERCKIVNDEYVTDTSGSGLVHLAPSHGFDDYRICNHYNLPQKNLST